MFREKLKGKIPNTISLFPISRFDCPNFHTTEKKFFQREFAIAAYIILENYREELFISKIDISDSTESWTEKVH